VQRETPPHLPVFLKVSCKPVIRRYRLEVDAFGLRELGEHGIEKLEVRSALSREHRQPAQDVGRLQ
jgi:hypothetical protein